TAREVDSFLARVPEHVLVVVDEAYREFVNTSDYPDSKGLRKNNENLLVLRTFSKFYSLAGIRIGYAIADRRVVDILNKVRQPFNVNRLAQVAAAAALDCVDEIRPFIEETIRERKAMRDEILSLNCLCPPSQTNFLFVVPKSHTGDICKVLEQEGIIVRPMAPFGAPDNSFRVNMGTPEENRRFLDACKRILS
ncbi:MAG: aminotransferase class I/II-fold pyridoxal phosphate-dependent enzyme, partial [Candidatus Krumholzibacteria bacterium]|nr:aminotransferase class I/II-fold pyridoxal phosphate-dependent enzyme [Candidatus Krumholzibacteria bacterium]